MALLSSEFLSRYENKQPKHKGKLFEIVYLRTYSRWIPELNRRENWNETVARVVEYNCSLAPGVSETEARELYDSIFNLEILPAGRTLWIGGTEASKRLGESNFNCAFVIIDEIEAFTDLFHLLLCGCGVGFRVLFSDVEKLPRFYPGKQLVNQPYIPSSLREDNSFIAEGPLGLNRLITVGDSREGWVQALKFFLEAFQDPDVRTIHINYDRVRPEGERIKTFGGLAPGPKGLMDMFTNLTEVLNSSSGKLTPLDCVDINNYIAKNVIVGGTRRSSQVGLGSLDDTAFVEAKNNMWLLKQNLQRAMSNNSVVFENDPTREDIKKIFEGIKSNGEPGFYNLKAARERRPDAEGSNPCMEISLSNRGFCNLSTINLMAFVENGRFNLYKATRAIRMAARIGLRTTNITVSLPKWDEVQKRDRLLGVSMTGIMDMLDACNIEFDSEEAIDIFKTLRHKANVEATDYSRELDIPRPKLVTTLKPEGTLSQLPTVSSGLHRAYAPYYIRRIRVSNIDPVCKALQYLGVPNEPDLGKAERIVFSFPIKTEAKIAASDEKALRQFQRYLTLMESFVDHNASCTLTVGPEEWDEIEETVYQNFNKMVACAFLPKDTTAYPQLPYEAISQEQYEEMVQSFPDLNDLSYWVNKFENIEFDPDLLIDDPCSTGVCPIR